MTRVITYIDGFNLYFGLKASGWRRYYWLDPHSLGLNLLKLGQTLLHTNYFTARISPAGPSDDKAKRQSTYLEAIETCQNTTIYYGHYLKKKMFCKKCNSEWFSFEEKMTDVNIAVKLLRDCYEDAFDTAILVSGDSDLFSPIETIRTLFPNKRVIVVFPPSRHSKKLESIASNFFTLGRVVIDRSQFPDDVRKQNGFLLSRPFYWK